MVAIHYPRSIALLSKSFASFITEKLTCKDSLSYMDYAPNEVTSSLKSNPPIIKTFYSNVRSLLPKTHLLHNYISLYSPDILAFSETWLDPDTPSSLFCPSGYVAYRDDRLTGRGSGSLILASCDLISEVIDVKSSSCVHIDAIGCKILVNQSDSLGVLCIYRPPNTSSDDNRSIFDVISNLLSFNFKYNIIFGDFNYPDIQWPLTAGSYQGQLFLDFCQENFLTQHVHSATRRASDAILDLVLTTDGTNVTNVSINEEFGSSDHSIIEASVNVRSAFVKRKVSCRNLRTADWPRFQELMSSSFSDWFETLSTKNLDLIWTNFLCNIISALNIVAPMKTVSRRNHISSPKIRTILRAKRRCSHNLRTNPTLANKLAYERSTIIANRELKKNLTEREEQVLNNPNQKVFWQYVNRRLSRPNCIKSIIDSGKEVTDNQNISNIMNDYFSSIFAPSVTTAFSSSNDNSQNDKISITHFNVTNQDVYDALKKIPPKTSSDGDGLSYYVLKQGGVILSVYLFHLFKLSIDLCRVPLAWKTAIYMYSNPYS